MAHTTTRTPAAPARSPAPARPGAAHQPAGDVPALLLQLQRAAGNQATQRLVGAAPRVQPALRVSQPGDPLEREADRVAEHVLGVPEPRAPPTTAAAPGIQRACAACAAGGTPCADCAAEEEHEDEPLLQRKESGPVAAAAEPPPDPSAAAAPPPVPAAAGLRAAAGGGEGLGPAVRGFFEPRFGRDLGAVRVHTGAGAALAAQAVAARAFTLGSDIYFNRGEYDPGSPGGRRLLAHELAHVLQQAAGATPHVQRQGMAGCSALLGSPALSLIGGSAVHRLIQSHFARSVPGAQSVMIPGASAGALRSGGICGEDTTVIPPQAVGGRAGAGFPDLARIGTGRILQVAEIKPAALPCLVDGEEQLLRYIDQGNATDPAQVAWRVGMGISVVAPMLPSAYTPPTIVTPVAVIRTAWCNPGLMAYAVTAALPPPVPVRREVTGDERERERERLRRQARERLVPVAVATGLATAVVVGRALWPHFWRVVVRRFAVRGAVAAALSLADGPLPFGELVSLGLALVTVIQIIDSWNELWREADQLAAREA